MNDIVTADTDTGLAALIAAGLTFGQCLTAFGALQAEKEPELLPYADAAKELGLDENDFSFDDEPIVSKGTDTPLIGEAAGAYVLCWRWVSDEEAGYSDDEPADDGMSREDAERAYGPHHRHGGR